ncbi:MAG TPA: P-loop NTPase, partial [Gaiellaceae bacterium]|nr:P-loop NTPase [Gaiellaceae bacterium]
MLRDYAHVLWQRKWIVLQAIVIVPVVAVFLTTREKSHWVASADVLLQPSATALVTGAPDQGLSDATLADLARVPQVAQRAIDAAHVTNRTAGQLLGESSVALKPDESILTVSVTDVNPTTAATLATAYARQYVRYRHQLEVGAIESARKILQARINRLQGTSDVSPATLDSLRTRAQQLSTLELLQTADAAVVRTAQGASEIAPHPVRNGLIGFAIGLILGVGLALLRHEFDPRVRTAHEIGERLHLPLLGRLPEPPRKLRTKDRLTMLSDPRGTQAESMRILRTNLELALFEREIQTIMVTSGMPGEGKTTTAANLAVAFARAGRRVVLVDLDLRG